MSGSLIRTRAPSNIALVKYMGKKDSTFNIPSNSSLSMTLCDLSTFVELRVLSGSTPELRWISELPAELPQSTSPWQVPQLSESAQKRIQKHYSRVLAQLSKPLAPLDLQVNAFRNLEIRTANNFPASSGIASSASSFAAITLALSAASSSDPLLFMERYPHSLQLQESLASISRQGSGSSCRSFGGPWVVWEEETSFPVSTRQMPEMAHFVLLIRKEPKAVGSSEAHLRVQSSPLWSGRPERAEQRVGQVRDAIERGDIQRIALETWREAWEMHSLFHTSAEPFTYWEPGTVQGLHFFSQFMNDSEPPIVTLDAGPNIHVIVPLQKRSLWREKLKKEFPECTVLEDTHGQGAKFVV
jgi:diphosphomevalonate decarboxylase